ncbi:MAG: A24 family peptidase [Alphaproteobacteria bacterium]
MISLIVFLFCVFVVLAVGALAGLSDLRSMTIPNIYSVYVIAAFVVAYLTLFLSGNDNVFGSLSSHLISVFGAFVVTFCLFVTKVIGAGDSKFGSACALWVSAKYLPIFLFFMALVGGVLGVVALILKRKKPIENPVEGSWVHQVQSGADKVPYGVAIAFGMLIAFVHAGYFSTDVLSSFLAVHSSGSGS